jgi:hypothetical protein
MGARNQGLQRPAIAPQVSYFKPLGVLNWQGHSGIKSRLQFIGYYCLSVDRPLQ